MDKLIFGFGGHPFTADDLDFLQTANRDAIGNSLSYLYGYTPDDLIVLNGCVVTIVGPTYTYTGGYIWLSGEIYAVPAQPSPQPFTLGLDFYINPVEVTDPAGTDTYQNATVQNTWKKRYASINQYTGYQYYAGIDYASVIKAISNCVEKDVVTGSWVSVNAFGGAAPALADAKYDISAPGQAIKFKKNAVGQVTIFGRLTVLNGAGTTLLFTLPAGYFPSVAGIPNAIMGLAYRNDTTTALKVNNIWVNTANGEVRLYEMNAGGVVNNPGTGAEYYFELHYQL